MPNKDIKKTKLVPKKRYIIFSLFFGLSILLLIALYKGGHQLDSTTVNGNKIFIEKLTSEKDKEKGLSGSKFLPSNQGVLFVYDTSGNWKIWMKDMNFSIDVIWLDDTARVVGIKEGLSPESYPEIFQIEQNSKYILELNSGAVKKYGIKMGDIFQDIQ